ncbi:hypothetical protein MTO96_010346 [Rhipicephalus appendiculatus]
MQCSDHRARADALTSCGTGENNDAARISSSSRHPRPCRRFAYEPLAPELELRARRILSEWHRFRPSRIEGEARVLRELLIYPAYRNEAAALIQTHASTLPPRKKWYTPFSLEMAPRVPLGHESIDGCRIRPGYVLCRSSAWQQSGRTGREVVCCHIYDISASGQSPLPPSSYETPRTSAPETAPFETS